MIFKYHNIVLYTAELQVTDSSAGKTEITIGAVAGVFIIIAEAAIAVVLYRMSSELSELVTTLFKYLCSIHLYVKCTNIFKIIY